MRAWRRCAFVLALLTAGALFCPGLSVQAASSPLPMPAMPQGSCHQQAPLPTSTPLCCVAGHHQASRPEASAMIIPAATPAQVVLPEPASIPVDLIPLCPALHLGSPPG